MPDKRTHRGPHPGDKKLFAPDKIPNLRTAVKDFSMLLTKGYAEKSALKLVGDRFSLTKRQRLAVMRSSCSEHQVKSRNRRCIKAENLSGGSIVIDGYNVLITLEAALSGGVILKGRDGCFKDLASIHGTYRKVSETIVAIRLTGGLLERTHTKNILWLLDKPVSNSGRLKKLISELAEQNNWNWDVRLSFNPDAELAKADLPVASSDGVVLDSCKNWFNLARTIIEDEISDAWLVDLCRT